MIPLSIPNFEGNESKYVNDAVTQGWVSTGGAYVEKFERVIAEYVDIPTAVACQSGTAGLHLALIEAGVGMGDMVIVPTLTFIAAVNPVKYVHAEPVFMDCDDSLCMDPVKVREFCEKECEFDGRVLLHKDTAKKIKAIIVVHVFGNPADMGAIMEIADKYHLFVIEDATEALGSVFLSGKMAGKMAGVIGDLGVYSFNGNKIITTGGGGMIVGKNSDMLKHIKFLSTQAKTDEHFYIHDEVGYNYRMTNVQAAIGVAQMEELEEFVSRKNRNYEQYKKLLEDFPKGYLLSFREGVRSNKWFYSVVMKIEQFDITVRELIMRLQEKGIQTRPIWGLIHEQMPYKQCIHYKIEKAKFYSERIINIPCSTNLRENDILAVADKIKEL